MGLNSDADADRKRILTHCSQSLQNTNMGERKHNDDKHSCFKKKKISSKKSHLQNYHSLKLYLK